MLEILKQYPNKIVALTDDVQAKSLLFELGVIDKFSNGVTGVDRPREAVTVA